MKKHEEKLGKADKKALIDESIELIGDKFKELCFKHDGCRILQALLKYGHKEQRHLVIEKIKDQYMHLLT